MRLLNVETFQLEEFFWKKLPPYAILSHTWGADNEEVSYQDAVSGNQEKIRTPKLVGCCKVAEADGLKYVWIDTCCIDKTNSVELQEAISSMFRWYQHAKVCYAYLSDVSFRVGNRDRDKLFKSAFTSSRWFKRGWTLQELLAPLNLRFYDVSWVRLGTKGDLSDLVEEITGIPTSFLLGIKELRQASVAQRMSWAAKRVTKRQEDTAYCLLGIFGVSMPMIYGEGDRAFRRLQEQIMKDIEDDSILAWDLFPGKMAVSDASPDAPGTALAPAPSYFANSGSVVVMDQSAQSSVEVQGGSLRVSLGLYYTSDERTLGLLKCGIEEQGVRRREEGVEQGVVRRRVGIPLIEAPGTQHNKYFRLADRPAELVGHSGPETQNTLVLIQLDGGRNSPSAVAETFWIHVPKSAPNLELIDVHPLASWHKDRALIEATIGTTTIGVQSILVRFRDTKGEAADFVAVLKPQAEGQFGCSLMTISRRTSFEEVSGYAGAETLKLSGNPTASNGTRSLNLELETSSKSLSQRSFVLRLSPLTFTPLLGTVNVTAELQLAGARSILMDLRAVGEAQNGEAKALRDRIKESKGKVARMRAELDALRAKISALQQQEQHLVEALNRERDSANQLDDSTGRTKKEEAAVWERIEGLEQLIDYYDGKRGVKNSDSVPKTAGQILPFAIAKGHDSLARLLLREATFFEERDLAGKTPLEHAISRGQDEFVQFLVKKAPHLGMSLPWGHPFRPRDGGVARPESPDLTGAKLMTRYGVVQQPPRGAAQLYEDAHHRPRPPPPPAAFASERDRAATDVTDAEPSGNPRTALPYVKTSSGASALILPLMPTLPDAPVASNGSGSPSAPTSRDPYSYLPKGLKGWLTQPVRKQLSSHTIASLQTHPPSAQRVSPGSASVITMEGEIPVNPGCVDSSERLKKFIGTTQSGLDFMVIERPARSLSPPLPPQQEGWWNSLSIPTGGNVPSRAGKGGG